MELSVASHEKFCAGGFREPVYRDEEDLTKKDMLS